MPHHDGSPRPWLREISWPAQEARPAVRILPVVLRVGQVLLPARVPVLTLAVRRSLQTLRQWLRRWLQKYQPAPA